MVSNALTNKIEKVDSNISNIKNRMKSDISINDRRSVGK